MDTNDTSQKSEARTVDPIQLAFAREAERLRNRRGISDGDLTIYEADRHEIVALATERVPMAQPL